MPLPGAEDQRLIPTFNAVQGCLDGEFGPNRTQLSFYNFSLGTDKYILANSGPTEKLPLVRQLIYCREIYVTRLLGAAPGKGMAGALGRSLRSRVDGDAGHLTRDSKREYYHYPPSPITNFAVTSIKGARVKGDFVISRGSGMFIANPSIEYNRTLHESLNNLDMAPGVNAPAHTIADAARLIFSNEHDCFQDSRTSGWYPRKFSGAIGFSMNLGGWKTAYNWGIL